MSETYTPPPETEIVKMRLDNMTQVIGVLNEQVAQRPLVEMELTGRPDLRLVDAEKLTMEHYGRLRNRAPKLAGRASLVGFVGTGPEDGDSQFVYGLMHTVEGTYGYRLSKDVLAATAENLGVHGLAEGLEDTKK